MEINIEPRDRYFFVRVTGTLTGESLSEYISTIMAFGREFGIHQILADERELDNELDTFEAYQAGEAEDIVEAATNGYRFACVPAPANRYKNQFFETMMRNRSVSYRLFDTIDEAEAWLLA